VVSSFLSEMKHDLGISLEACFSVNASGRSLKVLGFMSFSVLSLV